MAKTSLGPHYTITNDTFQDADVDSIKTQLEKFVATNKEGDKRIVFYSLRYSNLSDSIKESMRINESRVDGEIPRNFAAKVSKDVFIDQFKDVMKVQESGTLPKIIYYFDLAINDAKTKYLQGKSNVEINFITSSLGSAVTAAYVYDFYLNLAQSKLENKTITPNFQHEGFHYITQMKEANTKFHFNIYQLTNQLVLFGTSIQNWGNKKSPEEEDSIQSQLKRMTAEERDQMGQNFHLNVYSYRNPNDLLCLYVPPTFYQELLHDYQNVNQVVNIHYSNVLLHNDPITAHTFPLSSGRIAKRLSNGVKGKKNRR
jgi:hypothetical protein